MPAMPQCEGEQWTIDAPDELAHLVALVLIVQAFHAVLILKGTRLGALKITASTKNFILPRSRASKHRDGLLSSAG